MLNRVVTMAALAVGGMLLSKKLKGGGNIKSASSVEESIEVNVPVSAAYNQYIQFEDFPKFMSNVIEIRQLDGKHLHWRAKVGLEEKEWDAEITEQILDKRVAWRSVSGPRSMLKLKADSLLASTVTTLPRAAAFSELLP